MSKYLNEFQPTNETADEEELRELLGLEPDQVLEDVIQVCAGEWRREGDFWRVFKNPDWEE